MNPHSLKSAHISHSLRCFASQKIVALTSLTQKIA